MADPADREWICTWEDCERANDRDAAVLPLWRKIEWLEDVHRMALHFEAQRKAGKNGAAPRRDPVK